MSRLELSALQGLDKAQQTAYLSELNTQLENKTAQQRIEWAVEHLPAQFVLSSSFGIQAALTLHMVTQVLPEIPVILTDTGYLFPETYQFIEQLTQRLHLNLQVYRAKQTPAWQEAIYGQLWTQGLEGIERYNQLNKVEPMERALNELQAQSWFSGLRREQSASRANLSVLGIGKGIFKILPVIDWNNKQVYEYLTKHNLPYHPLWEQGYLSVGDTHTTRKWEAGMNEEDTRFFGLKRECGLHEN
ncbi:MULTISPECIES: phosphoadenosine phosphosulfate reductase [Providencia]|jgi:phosphoadenosine phosphosulfate reductase|uniref:phosphoadenosine phosphosulfate reductase n=1 Tax=Providencia TaxID=586 RepID=UPI001C5A7A92|nr:MULTISPECIES: phosphoadenosine phosphosulfate reductase [Providencia]ELR5150501.1 phosphoadenosine phosphosulfate reductase [Providencia rettgeri]MDR2227301.1 phosphoadenosine phosphosulfate reductase [Providencia sp.]QXX82890.1 phosphoadenosine phosphosulfate reductase [Providencia sp. R33]